MSETMTKLADSKVDSRIHQTLKAAGCACGILYYTQSQPNSTENLTVFNCDESTFSCDAIITPSALSKIEADKNLNGIVFRECRLSDTAVT